MKLFITFFWTISTHIFIYANSDTSIISSSFSTNLFALLRNSTDANLNYHYRFDRNIITIGFDFPLYDKRSSINRFWAYESKPSLQNNKVDIYYSRIIDSKSKIYNFIGVGIKIHNLDLVQTKLAECTSSSGSFFESCNEGYREKYSLHTRKIVPYIMVGENFSINKQMFISFDIRLGYSFVKSSDIQLLYKENIITKDNSSGFTIVNVDEMINHGFYHIENGDKSFFAPQVNFLLGYKFN